MPLHLSTDGVVTKCGRPVGELVLDGCTGDPDLFDCPECEDNLGRPYAAATILQRGWTTPAPEYAQGLGPAPVMNPSRAVLQRQSQGGKYVSAHRCIFQFPSRKRV